MGVACRQMQRRRPPTNRLSVSRRQHGAQPGDPGHQADKSQRAADARAMPPRSGGMTLIDTFAVSPFSNPAPQPVTSMPIATNP